ncbi:MAG: hypothetical protein K6C68_01355 [Ruminococcus sp.]|nr:hypothetical protein [Ruminococcus sp.]
MNIPSDLSEGDGPLTFEPYLAIFCIDAIEMHDGYNINDLKQRILHCLPQFLLRAYHTFPDIIADRPKPLPYEEPIHQKIKEGMALEKSIKRIILRNYKALYIYLGFNPKC